MDAAHQQINPNPVLRTKRINRVTTCTEVIPNPKAKLPHEVREVLRVKYYALRTAEVYIHWIKRYIFFHQNRTTIHDSSTR
jgi:hypothetical protein